MNKNIKNDKINIKKRKKKEKKEKKRRKMEKKKEKKRKKEKEIKDLTPVRGQDGKISETRGKDFYWSPTRQSLVGDQKSFTWVSEIGASLETTNLSLGCLRFFRLALLPVFDSFSH